MVYIDNRGPDRRKESCVGRRISGRLGALAAALAASAMIGGCQGSGDGGSAGARGGSAAASAADSGDAAWGLVLEYYSGPGHAEQAAARVSGLRRVLGREDIRIRERRDASVIVLGSYAGAEDPRARRDMAWARTVEIDGRRPWEMAYLSPPAARALGEADEANLAFAREYYGDRAEFTLQVGVYKSPDPGVARRAAEEAAARLRAEGDEAFYYHGPSWSSVTVGLFGPEDYDEARGKVLNEAILALQSKYPQNLLNGAYPIQDKNTGKPQRSLLVHVP